MIGSFAVVLVALAVAVSRGSVTPATASFGAVPLASRPYASHLAPITTTWYCPGMATGPDGGGEVVVANPTDVELSGSITVMGTVGVAPATQPLSVPARGRLSVDIAAIVDAAFVAAIVEIDGGEGMVEQRAANPGGDAVSSCTTQTSSSWYFADGYTLSNSIEQIILVNPSADTASVNMRFVTDKGSRRPAALQGRTIAPRSVQVLSIAESGFRDEPII
ncbi:MAG TPA: hypothetical protein PLV68_09805, partial [Ilumatobacteraceae bacterium]|nr:hypothetical protein [Ilumatobacteraceae bacterium]